MTPQFWLATTTGCQADPRLAGSAQGRSLQERCRAGSLVVSTRGWQTEVYADPAAQTISDEWRTALTASLTPWFGSAALNVLCSDDWHRSVHHSLQDLLKALSAWILLSSSRLARTHRIAVSDDGSFRRVGLAPATHPVVEPAWVEALIKILCASTASSARQVCDLTALKVPTREAMLVTLDTHGDGRPATINYFDHYCLDGSVCRLTLPFIYPWLIESQVTRRKIVSEIGVAGDAPADTIIVAPTRLTTSEHECQPAVAAILV